MTRAKQWEYFNAGYTIVGADGSRRKILKGDWRRNIVDCLGSCGPGPYAPWFYGSGPFPEDEKVTIEHD